MSEQPLSNVSYLEFEGRKITVSDVRKFTLFQSGNDKTTFATFTILLK